MAITNSLNSKWSPLARFHHWRLRHISERRFVLLLSIVVGIIAGIGATVVKKSVWLTHQLVNHLISHADQNYVFVVLPFLGLFLTVVIVQYIIRRPVRHGIPNVLYSIAKRKGVLSRHNLFSSVLTSALTVGFGGSVGLEGPCVATGAAYGSWLSRTFHLSYHNTILLLISASAGAMGAIFKAPIAAIVFAVEIMMVDLTAYSLIPLLLSSSSAVVTSYIFMGQNVLYPVDVRVSFVLNDLPYYVGMGIFTGLVSGYFTRMYMFIANFMASIGSFWKRLLIGSGILGVLIFLFPSFYGEGYEAINECLAGQTSYLFDNSLFYNWQGQFWVVLLLLLGVVFCKILATSFTFGAGGVGGIFAPTLFTGANTGMFFVLLLNHLGVHTLDRSNFALLGMCGLIAGVLQAPLTGIFLIADISGGYQLFIPLMITSAFAFLTVKIFSPNSVYHYQLAQRKELFTHDQDKNILQMMEVSKLVETDFVTLHPEATLRDLTQAISESHRDLFPVVDEKGYLKGMVKMDDIRHLIFKQGLYDRIKLKDLMYLPEDYISPLDSMDQVVGKFERSGRYNIAVMDQGKYIGFISKARVFSFYRKRMSDFSHD